MFDVQLSTEIYSQLMNGRIINKHILDNASGRIKNLYFTEIMDNIKDYRTQYQMNGSELVVELDHAYLRDHFSQSADLKTDITMKASLLLLLIGKYLTEHNLRMSKLVDANGGLTVADIETIAEMPYTQEILEKAKISQDLHAVIRSTLVERNIMYEKPSDKSYLLSDAGQAFFTEIVARYDASKPSSD